MVTRRWPAWAVALLLGSGGCGGCDSTSVSTGRSVLEAAPATLDFGGVYLGAELEKSITLSTAGDLPVTYRVRLTGSTFGFRVGPAAAQVAPNGSATVQVLFRPGRVGAATAEVVFDSNATEGAVPVVRVTGVGLASPDCEDGNGCTEDTFDPISGRCDHHAVSVSCDDFDACTTADTCVEGVCLGTGMSCDDGNPCTEDLCDPRTGCVHRLALSCDDNNPCTEDTCDAQMGCRHTTREDGTPCDDGVLCTTADICLFGSCVGVNVPDGTPCDDHEPCSKNDQCIEGVCRDPTYHIPLVGEVKFATPVGDLGAGAGDNPIVDRDANVFVGVSGGVVALDRCGDKAWENLTIGTPRWSGAVSIPGTLSVPVGDTVYDLDTRTGSVTRALSTRDLFAGAVRSSTTSTVTVRVLDLSVRASGGLVASVLWSELGFGGRSEGLIAEVDRQHLVVTPYRRLGALFANRLAIDRDEAVLAILGTGGPDFGPRDERLVRFGVGGLPETSWSTTATATFHSDLALGPDGEAFWTYGLLRVSKTGRPTALAPPPDLGLSGPPDSGAPVLGLATIHWVRATAATSTPSAARARGDVTYELVATSSAGRELWAAPLEGGAEGMSPVVDTDGNVFVTTADGVLHAFTAAGMPIFRTALPIDGPTIDRAAPAISPDGIVVVIAGRQVFGVKSVRPLGRSTWPRHRRDNLSTGHR